MNVSSYWQEKDRPLYPFGSPSSMSSWHSKGAMLPSISLHNTILKKNLVGEDPILWLKTLHFLRAVM
jgi:hypothetical protein